MIYWYIATVAPGRETIARDHIIRRGYEAFVPVQEFRRLVSPHSKRRETITKPWLPRYVFIKGPNVPWLLLERMTIVHGVLAPYGQPLAIPQSAIDWFIENNGRVFDERLGTTRPIRVDDLVRIASGPFCGQKGPVSFIKGKTAGINMKVLGSERIVRFPLDLCEVA